MHFRQFTCFHNKFPMIPCHVFHHPQSLLWWLSICSGLMTLHRKALYLFHTHRHHVSPGNWNTTQADSRIHQDPNLFVTLTNLTWEKKNINFPHRTPLSKFAILNYFRVFYRFCRAHIAKLYIKFYNWFIVYHVSYILSWQLTKLMIIYRIYRKKSVSFSL